MNGTYLGGDARTVRFASGNAVKEFTVSEINEIILGAQEAEHTVPAAVSEPGNAAASQSANVPEQQQQFCDLITEYRQASTAYVQEANPIQKAQMRQPDPYDYGPTMVALFVPSGAFRGWVGTLQFNVNNEDHRIALTFVPECGKPIGVVQFSTDTSSLFGSDTHRTRIHLDSPIAHTLAGLKPNQAVRVSGELIMRGKSDVLLRSLSKANSIDPSQRFYGLSDTMPTSIAMPIYLSKFTDVQRMK